MVGTTTPETATVRRTIVGNLQFHGVIHKRGRKQKFFKKPNLQRLSVLNFVGTDKSVATWPN